MEVNTLPDSIDITDIKNSVVVKSEIIRKWEDLHSTPGVFSYKLNVRKEKFLLGRLGIYSQLNPERAKLRRVPQQIASLSPTFDQSKFNFNKVKREEVVLNVVWRGSVFTLLVNQSPLTPYHCLICPRMEENIPQVLSQEAIEFSVKLLASIGDKRFRIGYNSPGALASVNHLHLHLLYLEQELLVDKLDLVTINPDIFKTPANHPLQALCFIVTVPETSKGYESNISEKIIKIIETLIKEGIPHNLFFTLERRGDECVVKVFLYVREKPCVVKDVLALNMAFCEFSGYVPLGDEGLYNSITEDYVIAKMKSEVGNVFEIIEQIVLQL